VVVLAATRAQAAGAVQQVAGLPVAERALRELGRRRGLRVVVASDGSIPLPGLPARPDVELRPVEGPDAVAALARELGAIVVGADVVRVPSQPLEGGVRVADAGSRRAAEDAVYADLLRGDLGLTARWLNKPLSIRLTRALLARLPVTPNQITLAAAAVGLAGCALIASGRGAVMAAGFFLQHLQSVLDGCDGELARVRFQQSELGAWLDTAADDLLSVLVPVALGAGLFVAAGDRWALGVGVAAGAMLLVANLIIAREMRRQGTRGDPMEVRWWFSGGRALGDIPASGGAAQPRPRGLTWLLFQLGRRDTAILGWFLLALVGWLWVVLMWAAVIAVAWFAASLVQLGSSLRRRRSRNNVKVDLRAP
jgi:phosphatidylglycerophosphate synthase